MKHLGLIILLSGTRLPSMILGEAVLPSLSSCQMSWEHRSAGKELWDSSFPRPLSPCWKCSCFFSISDQTDSSFASKVSMVCPSYCWVQLMISNHFRLMLFFLFNKLLVNALQIVLFAGGRSSRHTYTILSSYHNHFYVV